MDVKNIQPRFNVTQKQNLSFKGGVSPKLFSDITRNQILMKDFFVKAKSINRINNPDFIIDHAIFNAQEKIAEFFLTASDNIKNIIGLRDITPQKIISHGENIAEAFLNIDSKELKQANILLEQRYAPKYEQAKALREKIMKKH